MGVVAFAHGSIREHRPEPTSLKRRERLRPLLLWRPATVPPFGLTRSLLSVLAIQAQERRKKTVTERVRERSRLPVDRVQRIVYALSSAYTKTQRGGGLGLVALLVFKTTVPANPRLVGSIPTRLRQSPR